LDELDRTGASFWRSYDSIIERLTKNAFPIQLPMGIEGGFHGIIDLITMKAITYHDDLGKDVRIEDIPNDELDLAREWKEKLVEAVAGMDEGLMEKYLGGEEISEQELKDGIRRVTVSGEFIPVLTGTALKNKGVQPLLDAVIDYLPTPLDVPAAQGVNPDNTEEEVHFEAKDSDPLAAISFKIATDPFVGRITFVRVYSGVLKSGDTVYNPSSGKKERIGRLLQMHANSREEIECIPAGHIGAVIGLKGARTGDTLCLEKDPIVLESMEFPEPVISISVEPKTKSDQEKMGIALQKLAEEDPTFRIKTDEETNQTIMSGMGELHLDILVDRMKREFKVEANIGQPQVAYRETIQKEVEAKYVHKKQSGGRGQFGDVAIRMKPGVLG